MIPGMPAMVRQISSGPHPMTTVIELNRQITVVVVRQHTDEHFVCVELISEGCRLVLVNQYYQFVDMVDVHIAKTRRILREFGDREVLIAAAVKAKSALWHSARTDDGGGAFGCRGRLGINQQAECCTYIRG